MFILDVGKKMINDENDAKRKEEGAMKVMASDDVSDLLLKFE